MTQNESRVPKSSEGAGELTKGAGSSGGQIELTKAIGEAESALKSQQKQSGLAKKYVDQITEALRTLHIDNKIIEATNEPNAKFPHSKRFYIYVHYLKDGTPIYVGKGQGNRIAQHEWREEATRNPNMKTIVDGLTDKEGFETNSVKVAVGLTERKAYEGEKLIIEAIGRTQTNTGPLVNIMPGGGSPRLPDRKIVERKLESGELIYPPPDIASRIDARIRETEEELKIAQAENDKAVRETNDVVSGDPVPSKPKLSEIDPYEYLAELFLNGNETALEEELIQAIRQTKMNPNVQTHVIAKVKELKENSRLTQATRERNEALYPERNRKRWETLKPLDVKFEALRAENTFWRGAKETPMVPEKKWSDFEEEAKHEREKAIKWMTEFCDANIWAAEEHQRRDALLKSGELIYPPPGLVSRIKTKTEEVSKKRDALFYKLFDVEKETAKLVLQHKIDDAERQKRVRAVQIELNSLTAEWDYWLESAKVPMPPKKQWSDFELEAKQKREEKAENDAKLSYAMLRSHAGRSQ